MKFSFLVENKTAAPGVMAEHGLSIYIEAGGERILFDAGASRLVMDNARAMGIDLTSASFAVISHGHYDHTGGLPAFCEVNQNAPVYIHRNAFRDSFGFEHGKPERETSGIRWSSAERRMMEKRIVFTDGPVKLTERIGITGTVPYAEGFSPTEKFYYRDAEGQWVEDDMSHEQCLVIKEPEGLYIFSGCSHRGVISALHAGQAMFPGERMAALVAGMHLYGASLAERSCVIEQLADEKPGVFMPVHCTGIKAICEMKAKLGDCCVIASAGDVFYGRS